jgi:hypothetical protein
VSVLWHPISSVRTERKKECDEKEGERKGSRMNVERMDAYHAHGAALKIQIDPLVKLLPVLTQITLRVPV